MAPVILELYSKVDSTYSSVGHFVFNFSTGPSRVPCIQGFNLLFKQYLMRFFVHKLIHKNPVSLSLFKTGI